MKRYAIVLLVALMVALTAGTAQAQTFPDESESGFPSCYSSGCNYWYWDDSYGWYSVWYPFSG